MFEKENYTDILKARLEERMSINPSYSLRSFARDLGIKAPNLSNILNGKKGISETKALEICEKFGFSDKESSYFCDLVNSKHAKSSLKRNMAVSRLQKFYTEDEVKILKEDAFKIISDWYHYAILELITIEGFRSDIKWISDQLGITTFQTDEAIKRLQRLELIKIENSEIKSTGIQLETTNGVASESVRKLTQQLTQKAQVAITNQNIDERYVSTLTTAIHEEDFLEYGELIGNFKRDLNRLAMNKNKKRKPNKVYCLTNQFFKLTK